MKIQYAALDDDPESETKFSLTIQWDQAPDRDWAAAECAEDYFARHDGHEGWGDGQSRAFALFTVAGQPLGIFDVAMELLPQFHASPREPEVS